MRFSRADLRKKPVILDYIYRWLAPEPIRQGICEVETWNAGWQTPTTPSWTQQKLRPAPNP
ncbi:MAG: hypothetical protein OHK0035_32730 [Cyanobacteria bacterium J069]